MENNHRRKTIFFLAFGSLLLICPAHAQKRAIDREHSVLRVHVYKAGLFSALGHEHEIAAPIAAGHLEVGEHASVAFRVDAAKLKVLDPKVSEDDRAKVQKTMETEVLEVARFPEINFQSTKIELKGKGRWEVQGSLALHGRMRPLIVNVTQFAGEYRGAVTIKQSDFGITPVSVTGGAIKVKNEVRIEFVIALVP